MKLNMRFLVYLCLILIGGIFLFSCGSEEDKDNPSEPSLTKELELEECRALIMPSTVAIITKNFLGNSIGTGVVLDTQGHILTNAHLVSSYAPIYVKNPKRDGFDQATINGSSPCDDLAVITINNNKEDYLPPAFGQSPQVCPHDKVFVAGYSLNSTEQVTDLEFIFGDTNVVASDDYYQYYDLEETISVEKTLEREMSGGPLVNIYGEVVGIMTVGYTYEHSDEISLSHAIPMEKAQQLIPTLLKNNLKNMGVCLVPNDELLADFYGCPYLEGSLVIACLEKGSPLYEAGWFRFDVLYSADGLDLHCPGDFFHLIKEKQAGAEITLEGIGLFSDGLYRPYETTISIPR